ncbi:MAG: polysaccharide deacetylase family protein [Acidobacteria bacterium]|nr:polysaccharide deacetylase family protein [Acidobacteriota bacterium]
MWAGALLACGGLWWAKRRLRKQGAVVVLTFHRLLDEDDYGQCTSLRSIVMRRRTFESLVSYVARRYEAVDLLEAFAAPSSGRLRIAFTFDDGWRDAWRACVPLAERWGIPCTFFVCPGLTGQQWPFWPEKVIAARRAAGVSGDDPSTEAVIEQMKRQSPEEIEEWLREYWGSGQPGEGQGPANASWRELRDMGEARMRLGCHSATHQILTNVPVDLARSEVAGGRRQVEEASGRPCEVFSYPNGDWNPAVRELVGEAGYRFAFTTRQGAWTEESDRLTIPRMNACESHVGFWRGSFSPILFDYAFLWKAWRAMAAQPERAAAGAE